ncbi:MAG: tyrosine-type recombinase/integrase [Desulfovibrionaceae bacterium]|nr:tyrosine-type recombinase/integrase [Desulfovibrionaceae bacterium]
MRRLCEKVGVKRFGFHAIRHLTASMLFKQGYNVGIIQAILRHQSPNTTERYLKTLGLEYVRGAMEELFGKKSKVLK